MNTKFKPLGLAAAVAAATAGFSGVASAQSAGAINSLGDLVLVPYYTVREGFGTGIHLTNTSDRTQVVKVRFRRAADSMDALDFNIVMSPEDVWTGFLSQEGDDIVLSSQDTSCTAPALNNGRFVMPSVYNAGAEEGYVEMIAMGTPVSGTGGAVATTGEGTSIAVGAKHTSEGVPFDCASVRSNFFSLTPSVRTQSKVGVVNNATTQGYIPAADGSGPTTAVETITYADSGNALKISYFIRDSEAGLEFGNDGVHIANFLDTPAMSNQEFGLNGGDVLGFDYPDLDGADPATPRGKYEELRAAIGGVSIINDWSANADLNVGTDWVITVPGQYTMIDLFSYFDALQQVPDENFETTNAHPVSGAANDVTDFCTRAVDTTANPAATYACDNRDIPLLATFEVFDREEKTLVEDPGDLVVSPSVPGEIPVTRLPAEVNVVTWGVEPVLDSAENISVSTPDSPYGWAELSVAPEYSNQAVCNPSTTNETTGLPTNVTSPLECVDATPGQIPMVGFVAWERSFAENPDANYGRIVEHSYGVSSS